MDLRFGAEFGCVLLSLKSVYVGVNYGQQATSRINK